MNHAVLLSMASKANLLAASVNTNTDVVEPIGKFSDLLNTYGPLIVMLAVILFAFILLVVAMVKSNAKLMNQVFKDHGEKENKKTSIEENVLIKLVDAIASHHNEGKDDDEKLTDTELLDKVKEMMQFPPSKPVQTKNENDDDYHKDLVGAFIDVNMALRDASRCTFRDLKCSRVGIYVFHNGNKSMFGLPFFKMSCVHEWSHMGINTQRSRSHTDMPLHLFTDFIEDLWRYGFYKAQNVDLSSQKDPSIREFIAYSDTKALYFVAIKDQDGIISGFVVAEFDQPDTFEGDESRDKFVREILERMAIQVQPIVGSRYVYKNREASRD